MGTALDEWLRDGARRWPGVEVTAAALAAHLARHEVPVTDAHPHAADLYLACACAAGDPAAIAVFERELVPVARAAARRVAASDEAVAEVVQLARERLLVPVRATTAAPRIADYSGQGPLAGWVRIATVRIALNRARGERRRSLVDDDALARVIDAAGAAGDDRWRALARYGEAFSDALRAAFAALDPRERNLLRMHHLHGLTVDELAPAQGVHRATVARWIARARAQLLEETRAGLRVRLGAAEATVDSIIRELADDLEISVARLLAE
jgi:RNA polymerase sigma-70 factor (ECF subfamily)